MKNINITERQSLHDTLERIGIKRDGFTNILTLPVYTPDKQHRYVFTDVYIETSGEYIDLKPTITIEGRICNLNTHELGNIFLAIEHLKGVYSYRIEWEKKPNETYLNLYLRVYEYRE